MSTVVDNRVVEMRFDNKQFESSVATSMSTLDKLKQKLNLSGASDGLESVGKAAKKVSFGGLTSGIETVQAKFSALEVIGVTALSNITNSAVNAGKKIVSALTIDPIKTGFQEYETQINAIQTILANTESKGTTLSDVNSALDELNHYADMTIYNFTQMTRNIGTFTAAGVDLDTSVSAIKGIANLAAVSGSTSQQASTAMYQLSQALASGTVKLMDWNSVVNAGMGGQVFQDALKETARVHGIAIDQMIEEEGSFRETLSKGWLSSDILTETLSKFTGDLTEAELKSLGYTDEQIDSIIKMGQTANDAATKVKTLTQLYETLKEAAQSGWTETWEIIVGDFGKAKELFTGISDAISGVLNESSNRRNELLSGALYNNWDKLVSKINAADISTNTFEESLKSTMTEHGLDVDALVDKYDSLENVFKKGVVSSDILKEAVGNLKTNIADLNKIERNLTEWSTGDDVKSIQQSLKNLGMDIGEADVDGILGPATQEAIKAFQELKGLEADGIVDEKTLAALKEASSETSTFTENVGDLIDGVTELGGREKIIESFKNIFDLLNRVMTPIKGAFRETFSPITSEQINGVIDTFYDFTSSLKINVETIRNLKKTFNGLAAAIDIVTTVTGGGFKLAFKALTTILGEFNLDILDVTANIGDAIVKFRDWLLKNNAVTKSLNKLIGKLPRGIDKIKKWIAAFKETPAVEKFLSSVTKIINAFENFGKVVNGKAFSLDDLAENLGSAFAGIGTSIIDIFKNLWSQAVDAGRDFIAGFQNGLSNGFQDTAIGNVKSFCKTFINSFLDALGKHSPANMATKISETWFSGFLKSVFSVINENFSDIISFFDDAVSSLVEYFSKENGSIDWGKIFNFGLTAAAVSRVFILFHNFYKVASIFSNIGNILSSINKSVKKIGKAIAFDERAEGVKKLAESILMIAAAVAVLTYIAAKGYIDEMWDAVKVIGAISFIIFALALAVDKLVGNSASMGIDLKNKTATIEGLNTLIIQIGLTVLALVAAVKILSGMTDDEFDAGTQRLALFAAALIMFMAIMAQLTNGSLGQNADKVGKMMSKLAVAMLLMVGVCKLAAGLTSDEMTVGVEFMAFVGGLAAMIGFFSQYVGDDVSKLGGTMIKLAIAMGIMAVIVKAMGHMTPGELKQGRNTLLLFGVIIAVTVGLAALLKKGTDLTSVLVPFAIVVAVLGAVLYTIGQLPIANALAASASLAIALLSMAGALAIINKLGTLGGMGIASLAVVALVVAELAVIFYNLQDIDPVQMLVTAASLSAALLAISVCLTIVAGISSLVGAANLFLGVAAILSLVVGIIAIGELFGAGLAGVISLISDSLMKFTTALVAVGLAAAGLNVVSFDTVGQVVDILGKIGFNSLKTAIADFLIPGEDDSMSVFKKNAVALIDAMKEVFGAAEEAGIENTSALDQIVAAAASLSTLQQTVEPIGGLVSALKGHDDLGTFGKTCKSFIESIVEACDGLVNFTLNETALGSIITAGTDLADLQSVVEPIGGLVSALKGRDDLGTFGETCSRFIESIVEACDGLTDDSISGVAIENIKKAGEALVALQESLPEEHLFDGKITLSDFADYVDDFSISMQTFATAATGIDIDGVNLLFDTVDKIRELIPKLEELNGVDISSFTGIGTGGFGADGLVHDIAISIKDFADEIAELDIDSIDAATITITRLKTFIAGLPSLDASGIGNFQIDPIGKAISRYATDVTGVDTSAITASITSATKLKEFVASLADFDARGIEPFASSVKTFGNTMASDVSNMFDSDTVKNTFSAGADLMTSLSSGIASDSNDVKAAAANAVESAKDAVISKTDLFNAAGETLGNALVAGMMSKSKSTKNAMSSVVLQAVGASRKYYTSFHNAGGYLGSGLVLGITSKKNDAYDAGFALGEAAVQGEKDGQQSNSPSKLTIQAGKWLGEGLAIGINKMTGKVYSAGHGIGQMAAESMTNAVSRVADVFDAGFDAVPTIRPVVDLSDVQSGASAINNLLSNSVDLGANANLSAISRFASQRNQNGTFNDVVSAISKFNKDVNGRELGSTTYNNIGNVAYDSDTTVSNAVSDLVRALRVEGRV